MRAQNKAKTSILILDDDEFSRNAILKFVGYKLPEIQLYTADNCRSGYKLCRRHKIDMIITEIVKHRRQYQRIVERMRSINQGAKILLITSDSDKKTLALTSQKLDVSLVQMPVDLDELLEVTRTNIARIEEERNTRPVA